jgi:hypothetical protein
MSTALVVPPLCLEWPANASYTLIRVVLALHYCLYEFGMRVIGFSTYLEKSASQSIAYWI